MGPAALDAAAVARVHAGARERDHQAQLQIALDRLAANTRRLRAARDLSQEQLAEAVGCAVTFVQRLEGAKANTTVSLLASLARALEVDVVELFQPLATVPVTAASARPKRASTARKKRN